VEAVVLTFLRDNPELFTRLADGRKVDLSELHTRRAALAAQKDELATLFTDGVLEDPAVRRESAKLTQKLPRSMPNWPGWPAATPPLNYSKTAPTNSKHVGPHCHPTSRARSSTRYAPCRGMAALHGVQDDVGP
jgi:hypothetical protein